MTRRAATGLPQTLELVTGALTAVRRRRLPTAMVRALTAAAGRDFAALSPPAIDRRTADRLHRAGLMRVEWCAVLTVDGARLAQSLAADCGSSRAAGRALVPVRLLSRGVGGARERDAGELIGYRYHSRRSGHV